MNVPAEKQLLRSIVFSLVACGDARTTQEKVTHLSKFVELIKPIFKIQKPEDKALLMNGLARMAANASCHIIRDGEVIHEDKPSEKLISRYKRIVWSQAVKTALLSKLKPSNIEKETGIKYVPSEHPSKYFRAVKGKVIKHKFNDGDERDRQAQKEERVRQIIEESHIRYMPSAERANIIDATHVFRRKAPKSRA
jgi:hypothetical protein